MPGLRTRLLEEAGLWRRDEVPNKMEIKILMHLAVSKTARLIVRGDQRWGLDAGVTNNEYEAGFKTDGYTNLVGLLTDWHNTGSYRPWVSPDPEYDVEHKLPKGVHAYRINEKGYEAISQYDVWKNYDDKCVDMVKKLLKEYREGARALKPK